MREVGMSVLSRSCRIVQSSRAKCTSLRWTELSSKRALPAQEGYIDNISDSMYRYHGVTNRYLQADCRCTKCPEIWQLLSGGNVPEQGKWM